MSVPTFDGLSLSVSLSGRRWWLVSVCAITGVLPVALVLGVLAAGQVAVSGLTVLGGLLIGCTFGAGVGVLLAWMLGGWAASQQWPGRRPGRATPPDHRVRFDRDHAQRPPDRATPQSAGPLDLAARQANDGLWDWDLATDTLYRSPRWQAIVGVHQGDELAPSASWLERIHPEDAHGFQAALDGHLAGVREQLVSEARVRGDDGVYRWTLCRGLALRHADGRAYRLAGSLTDVTERRVAEARIRHGARHDALTGLANRAHFLDRFAVAQVGAPTAPGRALALLLVDVDRFKVVNDRLGHAVGDRMLVAAARRIEACVPDATLVARLGGDELAVVVEVGMEDGEAAQRAELVRQQFSEPLTTGGHQVFMTVSIGVTLTNGWAQPPESLLQEAETALCRAKDLGRDRVVLFEPALRERVHTRLSLESDLRRAIDRDELLLHYQPIVGLAGPGTFGVEVLVRWQHPERGLIPPDQFIPIAEESGLIVALGAWVLRRAVDQMRAWQREGLGPERICVNISARQLQDGDLPGLVDDLLATSGLDPATLELELTESVVAEHAEATLVVVQRLRALGVHLAVDDFGTGYSSLAYLARFPVSTLKIDRTFLAGIEHDAVNQAIVSAVTTLAHRVGARVVAEGIETSGQLAVARTLACDEVQGFLVSRPRPAEAMTSWLAGQRSQPAAMMAGGVIG